MNKILDYILKNIKIILFFIIIFIIIFTLQNKRIEKLNDKISNEIKLKNALLDTISTYRNKNNELVSEKLTMQETIKNLNEISGKLNSMQKELINRINNLENKNNIIAAALIETNLKIDSFLHDGETIVDTITNKIVFKDNYSNKNKFVTYKFTVYDIKPISIEKTPFLLIDSLYFPNKQYIDFQWKNVKKMGYPVSFSITNSNDFFKTENIESYVIPNITKEHLNPNGWQKVQNFYYKNKNSVIYTTIGVGVGVLGTLLISN